MKKKCKRLPKWSRNRFQNASKINARTGFRKMREIIKNHVSLKSKIIEIHCKNNGFWWFRRLHVRTVKISKKHQNETKFHPKFNEKSIQKTCSKKESPNMKTHQKNDPKMEPKSIKNHSKNRCEKRYEKKGAIPEKTLARQNARNPQRLSFQKTPSEENREESQLKLANKVECKKWSAKGTYRKASAEREPTQDLNTLGGQRPRADLIQVPTAKFRTWSQRMIFEWGFYHRFAWYELQDIQLILNDWVGALSTNYMLCLPPATNYMLCVPDDSMISQI